MSSRLGKGCFYLWLAYLVMMLCCVQMPHLHHVIHQGHDQTAVATPDSAMQSAYAKNIKPQLETAAYSNQNSQSLFQNDNTLVWITGLIIIFCILASFKNVFQRLLFRWRNVWHSFRSDYLLILGQPGLRAPPYSFFQR